MTIQDWLTQASSRLSHARLPDTTREAAFVLRGVLNQSVPQILLNRQRSLKASDLQTVNRRLAQRVRRVPLAYIEGTQPFLDFTVRVTPAVLIPRPETEAWVESLLERLGSTLRAGEVADIGTGSGCIALAMARHPKVHRVWGVDRSSAALAIARSNARRLKVGQSCRWMQGLLAKPLIHRRLRVDGLTANLPYISTAEMRTLAPELRCEPRGALVAGADGLLYIHRLLKQAPSVLRAGGWIALEVGHQQGQRVASNMKQSGEWTSVRIQKDFAGIARVVEGTLVKEKAWTI